MKWSVGLKITCKNAVAVLIILLVGFCNYYAIDRMMTSIYWRQHTYEVKEHLNRLLSLLVDTETGNRGYLLSRNNSFLAPYYSALAILPKEFDKIKALTADSISQQARLDRMAPLIEEKLSRMKEEIKLNNTSELLPLLESGKKAMDNIRVIINEMNQNEDELLAKRLQEATVNINMAYYTIVFGTGIAVIYLMFVGLVLSRHIVRPLQNMTNMATKIAGGELDTSFVPLNRQDEVGVLSQTFATMIQSLQTLAQAATTIANGDLTVRIQPKSKNDVLGNALANMLETLRQFANDTNETVGFLNKLTNEIYTSTSQLVSSGTETATAVSETTSTIEEVRQSSQLANQKANNVSAASQEMAQISQNGKQATQETNDSTMRIRDQIVSISESMMLLSEQTQGISSIVETVDDLAQQSNLLSVNASIEAEKAGEQGKGFRIVAQEIKNLADQSKQATHRVREILLDVQKATSTAVLATEQGNKVADVSVRKSAETGTAIEKLSASVDESAQAAIQIAASSQEQLVGLEQAAAAMENIKQASIQNVESVKQLEEATNNLKDIVEKLQKLARKYKTFSEQGERFHGSRVAAEEIA